MSSAEGVFKVGDGVELKAIGPVCTLGEGPHWDAEEKALYYVSILEKDVHRYDYTTGEDTKVHIGKVKTLLGEKKKVVMIPSVIIGN